MKILQADDFNRNTIKLPPLAPPQPDGKFFTPSMRGSAGAAPSLPLSDPPRLARRPSDAGLAIIPLSVAWTIAANVAGRLVTRTGFRRLVTFGSTCVFIGAAACVLFPVTRLGLTILGVGMGFTISTFTVAAQESAPITLRGTATSLTSFVRSLGGMIAIPSYGLLAGFDTSTPELSAITGLQDGLLRVFLSIAIAAAVSAIVVFLRFPHDKSAPVEA